MFEYIEKKKISAESEEEKNRVLVLEALEAMHGDDEKEKTRAWKRAAESVLEQRYGILDMSNIEQAYLLEITGQVLEEQKETERRCMELLEKEEDAASQSAGLALFGEIEKEIAERWMWETLGIDRDRIPGGIIDDAFKEYVRRLRDEAHLM